MSIELVMTSNHLILCCPLFLPPSIFPSIRVFSKESVLHITWPKYWSFSFNISPSNEYSGLIFFRMDWLDLLAVQGTLKSLLQHQFKSINSLVFSFLYGPALTSVCVCVCVCVCVWCVSHSVISSPLWHMDCSPRGSSVHGISRQEYWSGFPFSPPGYPYMTTGKTIGWIKWTFVGKVVYLLEATFGVIKSHLISINSGVTESSFLMNNKIFLSRGKLQGF